MASFQDNLGKMAQERLTILDFNEARDDNVAVANYLPLVPEKQPHQEFSDQFLQAGLVKYNNMNQ